MNGAFLGLNQSTKVTSKVKHKCASQQTQVMSVFLSLSRHTLRLPWVECSRRVQSQTEAKYTLILSERSQTLLLPQKTTQTLRCEPKAKLRHISLPCRYSPRVLGEWCLD